MYMGGARFTCVAPLLLLLLCRCCADYFELERKCGLGLVPSLTCVQDGTPT